MADHDTRGHLAPQAPRGGRTSLAREMFMGADERSPVRPGRFLETKQRLGILPTLAFWNRRDVWRSTRWFTVPVMTTTIAASVATPIALQAGVWPTAIGAPLAAFGAFSLALGGLERYIRKRVKRRHAGG